VWNSITNTNGYCDGDRYCDSYGNVDSDCHSYTYSYADSKTVTDSETYAHT
jgi:hypothetical protein